MGGGKRKREKKILSWVSMAAETCEKTKQNTKQAQCFTGRSASMDIGHFSRDFWLFLSEADESIS